MIISRTLLVTLAAQLIAVGAFPSPQGGRAERPYTFFLDGKSKEPDAVLHILGRPGHLQPGDAVLLDGLWLTLGEERECRLAKRPEGLRLEASDGSSRWVGIRVAHVYGKDRDFIDGLAGLSADEVHGLWGLRAEVWTPSCTRAAAWLDAARVFLSIGETSAAGHSDLPDLPSGLAHLEGNRLVDWKALTRLDSLVYLDVFPEKAFDLRLLAGLRNLRYLRLYGTEPFSHWEALSRLLKIDTLQIRFVRHLEDVGFARSLERLRILDIGHTSVRDLTPLGALRELEEIHAERSLVERLPLGELPALRSVDVIATSLGDAPVRAFREAHPSVRVRHRWNASLKEVLTGVTRVRIGPGDTCGLPGAPSTEELLGEREIAEAVALMEVDEDASGGVCGCLGGASLEFFAGDARLAEVSLVCGSSLRWSGWPGDGALPPGRSVALIDWLARHGVTGPRDQLAQERSRDEGDREKTGRAVQGLSPALQAVFEREGQRGAQGPGDYHYREFPRALAAEYPLAKDRIRVLLRIFGAEDGSWSGLGWQEQIAEALLDRYSRRLLQAACEEGLLSDDIQLRRGAARFWSSWQSPVGRSLGRETSTRAAFLDVLQDSEAPGQRDQGVAFLEEWWERLTPEERRSRLEAGLRDSSGIVRRRAMLVAGRRQAAWAEDGLLRALQRANDSDAAALALGYMRSSLATSTFSASSTKAGPRALRVASAMLDGRCGLIQADDLRTDPPDQSLQLAAVEAIVRCRGRHGLDLVMRYSSATHGWEPDIVSRRVRAMLLAEKAPGSSVLLSVSTLPQLRGWYEMYGRAYERRFERP
ncbi:MAG: hypothetical protein U0599_07010 [Vicinamibacteria bacterium]